MDKNKTFHLFGAIIAAGILAFSGVLINCFSASFSLLLLGRLLQGVGTGIGLPLMFHIILTKAPASFALPCVLTFKIPF